MMEVAAGVVAVLVAYAIGSIPFGYLVVRAVKGIDVRTVGSGNIGATNVGRVLGLPFFFIVFALDLAKGLLPTLFFPRLAERLGLAVGPDLPVLIGLAAILGHNFPIYLRFKGGKGVATSLGVLFALDAAAAAGAAVGFVIFLALTGFVSLSSILGGVCFVAVHFSRTEDPFSRSRVAMSIVSLALLGLVIVRHHGNLKRILAGTEPKVKLGGRRKGSARVGLVLLIAAVALGGLVYNGLRKNRFRSDRIEIVETGRYSTKRQRAERLIFCDGDRRLAVSCPRYGHVVLLEVGDDGGLRDPVEIAVSGRPVALGATTDRLIVLQRPHGDQRHLEEAYWQAYDFAGRRMGDPVRVGYDPDDLAISDDGRYVHVITSGHAEGETNRPDPEYAIYELEGDNARRIGSTTFASTGEDPTRLAISPDGRVAAVTLGSARSVARVDLSDLTRPNIVAREPLPGVSTPEAVWYDSRGRLWVTDPDGSTVHRQEMSDGPLLPGPKLGATADIASAAESGLVAIALPRTSAVALVDGEQGREIGRLPVRGTANLGSTRPLGVATSRKRGLLAVSNRAGGSVHLFKVEVPGVSIPTHDGRADEVAAR
ncbi:MAG: glycerol-3-phosphate 1-O-acyltransferase PlsY [Isosphaeraceae bacterium]|nr:glycerol-3-phosphate 1-O-acyltransferase PlsY [Isosphaeraceae bacterium]